MNNPGDGYRFDESALPIDPDAEVDLPRDRPHHLRDELDVLLVIAVGGFFGTLARYEVGRIWSQPTTTFPITTFVVNVSGALLIGVLLTAIIEIWRSSRFLRPLTCVGFLGGWTTMSALAVASDHLISSHHIGVAVLYILASAIAGPIASALGISFTFRIGERTRKSTRARQR